MLYAQFVQHIAEHTLSYSTIDEFNFRLQLYKTLDEEIFNHNNSKSTYTLGHNFMSTWTSDEKKRLNGYKPSTLSKSKCIALTKSCSSWDEAKKCCPGTQCYEETACIKTNQAYDDEVNWVIKGAVTPVKNQGKCGSCWSFSSTGALEGAQFISSNTLMSFSEEQLVECSTLNHGCNGGSMTLAFNYYKYHYAQLESDYPYTSGTGKKGKCKYNEHPKTKFQVSEFFMITPQEPEALKDAIATGPISVSIEANKIAFQSYKKGVITGSACGTKLDHGVLAVGYGSEDGQDYYLVKNSWGPNWGDQGYVKIGIETGKGVCGIQQEPVQAYSN